MSAKTNTITERIGIMTTTTLNITENDEML